MMTQDTVFETPDLGTVLLWSKLKQVTVKEKRVI